MIATVRPLAVGGWQLSTSHGVDIVQQCGSYEEAEQTATRRCQGARAFPLALDVLNMEGNRIDRTKLIPAPGGQSLLWEFID